MNKDKLITILTTALDELVKNDQYLLAHDVHEQTITGKLACNLDKMIPARCDSGWDVDVEYNRNVDVPKHLQELGNFKPDIIIHRRGENNYDDSDDNNLLIIEAKKDPSVEDMKKDINKVNVLMKEKPFRFLYGAFVEFRTATSDYKLYFYPQDDL